MKSKIIIIIGLTVQVLLYLVFFHLLPYLDGKYHGCYIHQDVYRQYIKSTVLDKFNDSKNHNNQTIIFDGKNAKEETMIFPGYLQDMYDFLNVGDSVIKERNSINYRVVSEATGKDTIFKFATTCKDSLVKKH